MLSNRIAVRVARNVAGGGGYTWVNEDFYEDEAEMAEAPDGQKYAVQRSQDGAPTLFLLDENYKTVAIRFRLNRRGTLQKLKNLRDWKSDGGRLLVYPAMQSDTSLYYDCVLEPGSIPDGLFRRGWQAAGETLTVRFLEFQKNAAIVQV